MRRLDIEESPIKATFIVLILLEIATIAYKYSGNFSDYITWVILLVAIPLFFFLAHYLKTIFGMANAQLKYSK
jgi:beta-lactamase regulating signal transducer with metallopeptidase domain